MSRPTSFLLDGTIYWTINTYDQNGVLVDADSNPYVDIRRNGTLLPLDVATISKRGGATGTYDCSYNPATDAEGDCYQFEETATISSQAYKNTWNCECFVAQRGTNGANTIAPANSDISQVLGVVSELQTNQGDWLTATGFSTFDPSTDVVANVTLVDTTTNVTNGGGGSAPTVGQIADAVWDESYVNHTGTATYGGRLNLSMTAMIGDITNAVWNELSLSHQVAGSFGAYLDAAVSGVGHCPTAGEVANAVWNEPTNSHTLVGSFGLKVGTLNILDVQDIVNGVWNENRINHTANGTFGFYLDAQVSTAGGGGGGDATLANQTTIISNIAALNDFNPSTDVVANVTNVSLNADMRGTDNANTVTPVDVSASVADILADTSDLQANQNQWLTATTTLSSNMRGTDDALLASSAPTRWSDLIVGGGVDLGKVTTSNPASGGGSAHTAQDVANLILAVPTTPLGNTATGSVALVDTVTNVTNSSGTNPADIYAYFTAGSNEDAFKADVSALALETTVQTISDDVAALDILLTTVVVVNQVAAQVVLGEIRDDTNELQANQSQWLTATGFSTPADISASEAVVVSAVDGLNDFDPAADVVAHVTLVDTTTNLTNGGGGGGDCPTAQEIVDAWGNQPQGVYVTSGTLGYYLDAQVSTAGSGGAGLYQATVRVQDNSLDALQGARVNVDGTTLTLTTNSSGEVTFNLDSGVYLLEVSPPANYDTPVGQVLTVSTSDPSETIFTLSQTTPPTGCTPIWLG